MNPPRKWTAPDRVARVMAATDCTADAAAAYLIAEEGDESDAVTSYRGDHTLARKPLGLRHWIVRKGTTRMRVLAETIVQAGQRAAELGLRNPDSVVLDDDREAAEKRAADAWPKLGGRDLNPEFLGAAPARTGEDY